MDRVRYLIGLLTLALALAGGVFLFSLLSDEDQSRYFRLNIELRDVGGLLPGADVKYRGVVVGSVRTVALRDDGEKGVATIVLTPGQEHLARTNSKFWVVTPRFGGLAGGASGLDTLVRDAYLSFYTPDPLGVQLANGSSVVGHERPYHDVAEVALAPARRGDLLMTLLVTENHGLAPGSAVMFRGVQTGDVRSVALAADGSHVRIGLRIDREHRGTVTDRTRFWVARPRLSGAFLQGFDLQDAGAILSPFIGYYTRTGEGLPVPDGHVVAAETVRPEFKTEKVEVTEDSGPPPPARPTSEDGVRLARVIYEAVEEDTFSPDDQIRREGTGVVFSDPEGRPLVLTARSVCDASYFVTDVFGGEPEVISEGISVELANGQVARALRTWVDGSGRDLSLLVIDLDPKASETVPVTPAALLDFGRDQVPAGGVELLMRDGQRRSVTVPAPEGDGRGYPLQDRRGAVALLRDRVVGVLVQAAGDAERAVLEPLSAVPEALRPPR